MLLIIQQQKYIFRRTSAFTRYVNGISKYTSGDAADALKFVPSLIPSMKDTDL